MKHQFCEQNLPKMPGGPAVNAFGSGCTKTVYIYFATASSVTALFHPAQTCLCRKSPITYLVRPPIYIFFLFLFFSFFLFHPYIHTCAQRACGMDQLPIPWSAYAQIWNSLERWAVVDPELEGQVARATIQVEREDRSASSLVILRATLRM